MQNQTLTGIIEAILKPLRFASKDNFAHLHAVKGLQRLVTRLCLDAARIDGLAAKFIEIKDLFNGFDGLSADRKKEAIQKTIVIIDSDAAGLLLSIKAQETP